MSNGHINNITNTFFSLIISYTYIDEFIILAGCPAEGWLRRDKVSNCYLFGTEDMNFNEAKEVKCFNLMI